MGKKPTKHCVGGGWATLDMGMRSEGNALASGAVLFQRALKWSSPASKHIIVIQTEYHLHHLRGSTSRVVDASPRGCCIQGPGWCVGGGGYKDWVLI